MTAKGGASKTIDTPLLYCIPQLPFSSILADDRYLVQRIDTLFF